MEVKTINSPLYSTKLESNGRRKDRNKDRREKAERN
jgi:hypothetical protein